MERDVVTGYLPRKKEKKEKNIILVQFEWNDI